MKPRLRAPAPDRQHPGVLRSAVRREARSGQHLSVAKAEAGHAFLMGPTRACMFPSAPGFILAAVRRAAASSRAVDRGLTIGSKAPIQMAHSACSPVVDTLKGR